QSRRCLLTDKGNNGGIVHLGIVKSVEEVNGTGPRGGEADPNFIRKLRMSTGHEGSEFLMSSLDKSNPVIRLFCALERTKKPVDAVPGVSIDWSCSPSVEA